MKKILQQIYNYKEITKKEMLCRILSPIKTQTNLKGS